MVFSKWYLSMSKQDIDNTIAVVLGGHVNGLSIIRELSASGVRNIGLLTTGFSIAQYSNKVLYHTNIGSDYSGLVSELKKIRNIYDYIVVYPTDDRFLELLTKSRGQLIDFCFLPFNESNLEKSLDKAHQYEVCEALGVPYPKTIVVQKTITPEELNDLQFPILVKPAFRYDESRNVFRNRLVESLSELRKILVEIEPFFKDRLKFIFSEYIPGSDSNIFSYACFMSKEGQALNEWVGKKLSQHPDQYGVFASASNEAADEVVEIGRRLVAGLDAVGYIQPEFKFDHRDGKYKLMEVNMRPMMWNRVGFLSGVCLHLTQFEYATNSPVTRFQQYRTSQKRLVLMLHEIPNLITRPGYGRIFYRNIFGVGEVGWAIFDPKDPFPFIASLRLFFIKVVGACLKRLGLR